MKFYATTLPAVAIALAHIWKSDNQNQNTSPKEQLRSLGIEIPPDVIDNWEWFDFLSLVEQSLLLKEAPPLLQITNRSDINE